MTLLWLVSATLAVSALLALALLLFAYPSSQLQAGTKERPTWSRSSNRSFRASLSSSTATLPLKKRLLIGGGCCLPLAALAAYLETLWLLAPALVLFLAAPEMYLAYLSARDRTKKEAQVPDLVETLCRALKAGSNLYYSLARATEEVGPPLGHDLKAALDRFSVTGDMASTLIELRQEPSSRRLRQLLDVLIFDLEEGVAGTHGEVERLESFLESLRQEVAVRRELTTRTAGTRFNLRLVSLTIPGTVLLVVATDSSLLTPLLTNPFGNMSLGLSVVAYLGTLYLSHRWSKVEL